ncbi:MAG TPA: DoxX family membrane protein [Chryseolinea sp.]|nr:DoxX family membrane protein [Chryseolinea sp.]
MTQKAVHTLTIAQHAARVLLGIFILFAGIGHLSYSRKEFQAQVPPWLPLPPDLVVVISGIVEILIGASLVVLLRRRIAAGWIAALFFVLVFPGNIAQLTEHRDAFGLNSELARWLRLPFQGVLIVAALWSTGAWQAWRHSRIRVRSAAQPII